MTFRWPVRCRVCGEPGKRLRPNVWTHQYPLEGAGRNVHGFVPAPLPDVVLILADEQRKDRTFMRRFHRDELRDSEGFERERAELDFGPLETPEEPEHGLTEEDLAS